MTFKFGPPLALIVISFILTPFALHADNTSCSPYDNSFVGFMNKKISPLNTVTVTWNITGYTRSEPVDIDVITDRDGLEKQVYKIASKLENVCGYSWFIQPHVINHLNEENSYYLRIAPSKLLETPEFGGQAHSIAYSDSSFRFSKTPLPMLDRIVPHIALTGAIVIIEGTNFSNNTRVFIFPGEYDSLINKIEVSTSFVSAERLEFTVPTILPRSFVKDGIGQYYIGVTDLNGSIESLQDMGMMFSLGISQEPISEDADMTTQSNGVTLSNTSVPNLPKTVPKDKSTSVDAIPPISAHLISTTSPTSSPDDVGDVVFQIGQREVLSKTRAGNMYLQDQNLEIAINEMVITDYGMQIANKPVRITASQIANNNDLVPISARLITNDDTVNYEIEATTKRLLFGLFPISIKVTVYANAETGTIFKQHRPWYWYLTKK